VTAFLALATFYRKLAPNVAETAKPGSPDSEKWEICLESESTGDVIELER
jgi:hypothetical protein